MYINNLGIVGVQRKSSVKVHRFVAKKGKRKRIDCASDWAMDKEPHEVQIKVVASAVFLSITLKHVNIRLRVALK